MSATSNKSDASRDDESGSARTSRSAAAIARAFARANNRRSRCGGICSRATWRRLVYWQRLPGYFAWSARSSFLPAHEVTVTPVIVTRAEVQQAGTPLFQAAGWIEPRPTAVVVSSLAEGVVEEIYAVEGQYVERGKPVAKLFDTDAKLAVQQADANLRLCEADVRNAEATLAAAHTALENPNESEGGAGGRGVESGGDQVGAWATCPT